MEVTITCKICKTYFTKEKKNRIIYCSNECRYINKLNSAKNDRNIDEYWTNEYAIDNGYGSFPYGKVEEVANTWTIKS